MTNTDNTRNPHRYDALADEHCTYTLSKACATSPYGAAMRTRRSRAHRLTAEATAKHAPKWPKALHEYRLGDVMPSSSGPPRAGDKGGMDHHVPKMQARLDKTYGRSMADPVGSKGRVYDVSASLTHYSSGSAHPADGARRFASVRRDAWYRVPPHATRSLQGDNWIDLITTDALLHQDDRIDADNKPVANANIKPIAARKPSIRTYH